MSEPPQPPVIKNIIFDEDLWHPFDHIIGSPRCLSFQKTKWACIKKHWELGWEYKWSEDIRRWTLCRLGKHHSGGMSWRRVGPPGTPMVPMGYYCNACGKKLADPEEKSDA